jgi:hypothetical protein
MKHIEEVVNRHFALYSPSEIVGSLNFLLCVYIERQNEENIYQQESMYQTILDVNTTTELILNLYEAMLIDERFKGSSMSQISL